MGRYFMNVDPKKIKELIMLYSQLDEEYQVKLLNEAYILLFKQTQKNQIKKENIKYATEEQLQQNITKRANENIYKAIDFLKILDKVSDTDKAALFMVINRLSGKANTVTESDISITVNQKEVSVKDYLDKYLSAADYDKAKKMTDKLFQDDKK